jgi:uncharacterized protein
LGGFEEAPLKQFMHILVAAALWLLAVSPVMPQEQDRSETAPTVDTLEAEGDAALKQALDQLLPAAEAGDARAQYLVGKHFDFGWGVKADGWKAISWYAKAANQGYLAAQVALGNLYAGAGYGYLRNDEKAFYWFSEAAKRHDPFSETMIGDAYSDGKVVPRNYRIAAEWYKRAIEGGYFLAPYKLARLYAEGKGVPLDLAQAYAWNSLSAATGNLMAREFLDALESRLPRSEVSRAQEMAAMLHAEYADRIANHSNRREE